MGADNFARTLSKASTKRLRWFVGTCGAFMLATVLFGVTTSTAPASPQGRGIAAARAETLLAGTPKRGVASPSSDRMSPHPVREGLESVFKRTEGRFRAALEKDPIYQRYLDCVDESGAERCRGLLSDALYSASSMALEPFVKTEGTLLRDSAPTRVDEIRDQLSSMFAETRDPTKSLTALMLVQHVDREHAFPLPAAAYRDLGTRTDPEIQTLLEGHVPTAFPTPSIAAEVADLALSPGASERVRLSAVRALGREQDVSSLTRIADAFMEGNPTAENFGSDALPGSLARCAMSCSAVLEQLAVHSSPPIRQTAYRALGRMRPDWATRMKARLAELSPELSHMTDQQLQSFATP